jgi:hypothetical protein
MSVTEVLQNTASPGAGLGFAINRMVILLSG